MMQKNQQRVCTVCSEPRDKEWSALCHPCRSERQNRYDRRRYAEKNPGRLSRFDGMKPGRHGLPIRFWASFTEGKATACWMWEKAYNVHGYARYFRKDRYYAAHRLMYEAFFGKKIEAGMHIDHLCRNRGCVNPHHLEKVTARTNILRGIGVAAFNARKTHCKNGHEMRGDNVRIYKKRESTTRLCVACSRLAYRRYQNKLKGLGCAP